MTPITSISVTDNLSDITGSTEALNSEIGRLSGSNSAFINSTEVERRRIDDHIGMLHTNMGSKMHKISAFEEQIQSRLQDAQTRSTEFRKARSAGDEVEPDNSDEDSSFVDNDLDEDVSGGRSVHPVYGIIEES